MKLLHLSDIHFGVEDQAGGKKPKRTAPTSTFHFVKSGGSEPNPQDLVKILVADQSEPPDAIIVSGDIGWSGSSQDYGYALTFFSELQQKWKSTQIIIAPGNHDMTFAKTTGEDDRQDAYIDFIKSLYGAKWKEYYPFLDSELSDLTKRERLIGIHRVKTHEQDSSLFVSINSAAAIGNKDNTCIHVRKDVLDAIETHLKADRFAQTSGKDGELRVLVVHHHLFPFYELNWGTHAKLHSVQEKPDETLISNSAELQSWLSDQHFKVVLHGHKHIPHGRLDTLYRKIEAARPIIVLGAGSSGVYAKGRSGEPLSYNRITTCKLSDSRWSVQVETRSIPDKGPDKPKPTREPYRFDVGAQMPSGPLVFWAERMSDCHRAMQQQVEHNKLLYNFVSSVETCEYKHPSSTTVSEDTVHRSFRALHPEWVKVRGWAHPNVQRALDSLQGHRQFQHGARLFASHENSATGINSPEQAIIRRTLAKVSPGSSRAYVGLYDPSIDPKPESQMPTLIGVQFLQEGKSLNLIVTFRKIELSTWWLVNMYEAIKLLHWATQTVQNATLTPGRITFFSSIAEWKTDPKLTVIPYLDDQEETSLGDLARLSLGVLSNDSKSKDKLKELLKDKLDYTNGDNIDPSGLERLTSVLEGIHATHQTHSDLISAIRSAAEALRGALDQPSEDARLQNVTECLASIERAIELMAQC